MSMKIFTKIALAWELHEQGVPNTKIATHIGKHRETVGIWINQITMIGLEAFLDQYDNAKKGSRQKRKVDAVLKRLVWQIRQDEQDCCGQKIQFYLKRDYGVSLGTTRIYEILNEKFEIKSKWKKGTVIKGPVPTADKPRQVIQMDTIDFGDIFAFTVIDIVARDADVFMAPALTGECGHQFLQFSMPRRFNGHVDLIQTDGGPEFKEAFSEHVLEYCHKRRVARPYKKNEQSYIESFNRTVRKECLGWVKYRQDEIKKCQTLADTFLERYHYHRPHMGLGMKPPLTK